MLKRLLLYLNSQLARTLPIEHVQKSMANNWKTQWPEWKPEHLFPDTQTMTKAFLRQHFEPTLRPESCVIEFGCADAWYLLEIAPQIKRVYGFDISSTLLKTGQDNAKERGIANLILFERDLQQWINSPEGIPGIEKRISGESNDKDWEISHIIMGWILLYFANDSDVLKMLEIVNRLLPQNGHFWIRETLVKNGQARKIHSLSKGYMAVYRTYKEYREMIEISGFNIDFEDAVDFAEDTRHHVFLCSKGVDVTWQNGQTGGGTDSSILE